MSRASLLPVSRVSLLPVPAPVPARPPRRAVLLHPRLVGLALRRRGVGPSLGAGHGRGACRRVRGCRRARSRRYVTAARLRWGGLRTCPASLLTWPASLLPWPASVLTAPPPPQSGVTCGALACRALACRTRPRPRLPIAAAVALAIPALAKPASIWPLVTPAALALGQLARPVQPQPPRHLLGLRALVLRGAAAAPSARMSLSRQAPAPPRVRRAPL